ncbi:MAG TPA: hypothetical protein VMD31_12385 [Opitutaceae bacterium]|nr:hypothetical protein [Opitutaceae bacterium]
MDQTESKPGRGAAMALDTVLTLAVFALFTWIMRGHVTSNDPFNIWFWALVTSSCLTAVFWLALQMFRAVLRAQREAGRSK